MGITLSTGDVGDRPPTIKLVNAGDYADFALVNVKVIPRTEYGTGNVRVGANGKPQNQEVLTVVVIGGTGVARKGDTDVPLSECVDELATVYVAGRDRYDEDGDNARASDPQAFLSWMGAKRRLGRTLNVGDVCRWKYEGEVPGQGPVPRKVRTFRLRAAKPEEADRTAKCEDAYRNATSTPIAAAGGYDDPF
jgi:hypothetical protein